MNNMVWCCFELELITYPSTIYSCVLLCKFCHSLHYGAHKRSITFKIKVTSYMASLCKSRFHACCAGT
jgi:hypothetical protein